MESRDLRAKYKRRRVSVAMRGAGISTRDPMDVARNAGRKRLVNGEWIDLDKAPKQVNRARMPWKKHIKEHDTLVKQVEHDEWQR